MTSLFQFLRRMVAHALWNAALSVHPDSDPQTAMNWERIGSTWFPSRQRDIVERRPGPIARQIAAKWWKFLRWSLIAVLGDAAPARFYPKVKRPVSAPPCGHSWSQTRRGSQEGTYFCRACGEEAGVK